MVDYMVSQPDGISRANVSSLHSIALNVLAKAAYGYSKDFKPLDIEFDPAADLSYADGVWVCTTKLFLAAFFPLWFLRLPFMSNVAKTVANAKEWLPNLTKDMLETERKLAMENGSSTDSNLMSMLVRLSDGEKTDITKTSQALKDEEISGNLFAFSAAGFDTTANTMGYALVLLAAYPEWQEWVQEELDYVWSSLSEEEKINPSYSVVYPQVTRILALMVSLSRYAL